MSGPHSRVLEIHGADLHVDEHGRGASLVLVHGGLGSAAEWAPMIPLLADRFHVITLDNRGHGRSTNPRGVLSYPTLADDLAALIAAFGLERPVVGGWSDGGQIVLELAVRHPEAAGALVVGGAYPDFVSTGLHETHRALLGADAAGNPDLAHLAAELSDAAEEIRALHLGGQRHWAELIRQTAGMWLEYPGLTAHDVAAITHPTLVLAADRDEIIPLDLAVALYRALPNAEFAVGPRADHAAPLTAERAPVFAALIGDFAQRYTST